MNTIRYSSTISFSISSNSSSSQFMAFFVGVTTSQVIASEMS
ncbi:MAG: hypothetical protein ACOZBL_01745 [Patescibacteria group bacterium]